MSKKIEPFIKIILVVPQDISTEPSKITISSVSANTDNPHELHVESYDMTVNDSGIEVVSVTDDSQSVALQSPDYVSLSHFTCHLDAKEEVMDSLLWATDPVFLNDGNDTGLHFNGTLFSLDVSRVF